jgi:prepilin-type N-terminal cleavage/methylation domain-containing protein
MMRNKQKGFSLIELLIVVAIILIIAAIAIPNLLRSRIAANESSAVGSLRTLVTAQVTYATTYPTVGFAGTLANLAPPGAGVSPSSTAADLIDTNLASGVKSGYTYGSVAYSAATNNGDAAFGIGAGCTAGTPAVTVCFQVFGGPVSKNRTGIRNFCTDEGGVIRQGNNPDTACDFTTNSPPVG